MTNGQTACVYGGDCQDLNRYFCVYAEASDGTVWSGPYMREVTNNVYQQCEFDDGADTRTVGFYLLDIGGNDDYTDNLVPAGYQPPPPPKSGGGGGGGGGWGDDDDDDDDDDDGGGDDG